MFRWPHRIAGALLLAAVGFASAHAAPEKLDGPTRAAISRLRAGRHTSEALRASGVPVTPDGALIAFVRGTVTRARLEAAGAQVRTSLPGLFTVSIPAASLDRVLALADVTAIRAGARCAPELDASLPTTGLTLLRGPGPAFPGVNGQGVLVGIVDSGIDFDHPDFKDSTGATRIATLWDQEAIGTGIPGFPYGKECTRAQIDAATCAQLDLAGHGTHAAGIAAGDGSQTGGATPAYTYAGMAPRSELVVVKTDYYSPDVVDAVSYVFTKAAALGKPAVVNLSLGTHFGSHDGGSAFEKAIGALTGPGRIVVKSAGNDRGTPVHAQVFATAGGTATTLSVSGSAVDRFFSVDAYYNSTERLRVRVQTPNGTTIGPLLLNTENAPWPGQATPNGVVYLVHDSIDASHRNIYLEVYVEQANKPMNGTWTITLFADQLGAANGEVDLWRYYASPGVTANFVVGSLPTQELITEPGNSDSVITVGAWVTKTGWTACNGVASSYAGTPAVGNLFQGSSPGPTRDGRTKPDLVAPGIAIGSSTSFDAAPSCPSAPAVSEYLGDGMNHRMLAGTSLSAPHVTGAVALLLQKRGALTPAAVKAYLTSHARSDGFTGTVPTSDWGYGKLDLGDLVDPTVQLLGPNGGQSTWASDTLEVTWTAGDSLGSVASVDLQLSRAGRAGPFEDLALGLPNSGSYSWIVTGPPTASDSAFVRVVARDTNGNTGSDLSDAGFTISQVTGVAGDGAGGPLSPRLVPNPTAGRVEIQFGLARAAPVRVAIHDVQGREVSRISDGPLEAGRHVLDWRGTRDGRPVPPGLYFVVLELPGHRQALRLAVTR